MTFTRWYVLHEDTGEYAGKIRWVCRCSCGVVRSVVGSELTGGRSKSCGCYASERTTALKRTHGMGRSAEYRAWSDMWRRCTDTKNKSYHQYKWRTPPESWKEFAVFLSDMGAHPGQGFSLERVNNDLPYGPDNCKWATKSEQACNTSQNILVVLDGETVCFTEACRRTGLKAKNAYVRWYRSKDMRTASNGLFDLAPD